MSPFNATTSYGRQSAVTPGCSNTTDAASVTVHPHPGVNLSPRGPNRTEQREAEKKRKHDTAKRLLRNGGVEPGDLAGNFVVSVIETSKSVGGAVASMVHEMSGHVAESAGQLLCDAWNRAGSLAWNAWSGVDQLSFGPPGATAAQVPHDADRCTLDGGDRCVMAQASEPVQETLAQRSQTSLDMVVEKFRKNGFDVELGASLKNCAPGLTMSNKLILFSDTAHHDDKVRASLKSAISQTREQGDKFFVELPSTMKLSSANCYDLPVADCIAIDDPDERARLAKLEKEALRLAKESLAIFARNTSGKAKEKLSNPPDDYFQVRAALKEGYQRIEEGKLVICSEDLPKLLPLKKNWAAADQAYSRRVKSEESRAIREEYMAKKLVDASTHLDGHKGQVVVGSGHEDALRKRLDKAKIDYVVVRPRRSEKN